LTRQYRTLPVISAETDVMLTAGPSAVSTTAPMPAASQVVVGAWACAAGAAAIVRTEAKVIATPTVRHSCERMCSVT
jgi:hypothetical protein